MHRQISVAGIAQSVERQLPKLQVAGSRPVSRSKNHQNIIESRPACRCRCCFGNRGEESPGNTEQPPFLTGRWPRGRGKCRRKQPPERARVRKRGKSPLSLAVMSGMCIGGLKDQIYRHYSGCSSEPGGRSLEGVSNGVSR